jgi:hypothetical protein
MGRCCDARAGPRSRNGRTIDRHVTKAAQPANKLLKKQRNLFIPSYSEDFP